ncbi:hypothetical protein R1sor_017876 [Riccia sorocarpa]|uniref:Replication factor A C-terminal domain-containing protein n=1 Tax=Riccia sorocarpa TaxID=122646 RepID=A0ABD3IBD8_9MARC
MVTSTVSLSEAKEWVEDPSRGNNSITMKARIVTFGQHDKTMYSGCPICTKSVYSSDRCSHSFITPKNYYWMKIFLEDETGELDTTVWESARYITGMSAEEFEALHLQAVGKKELFPEKTLAFGGSERDAVGLTLVSSPESQVSAFGEGFTPQVESLEVVRRSTTGKSNIMPRAVQLDVDGGGNAPFLWDQFWAMLSHVVGCKAVEFVDEAYAVVLELYEGDDDCSFAKERLMIEVVLSSRGNMESHGRSENPRPEDEANREQLISWLEEEVMSLREHVLSLKEENDRVKFAAWRWKGRWNIAMLKKQECEELSMGKEEEAVEKKAALRHASSLAKLIRNLEKKLLRAARESGKLLVFPDAVRTAVDLIMTDEDEDKDEEECAVVRLDTESNVLHMRASTYAVGDGGGMK